MDSSSQLSFAKDLLNQNTIIELDGLAQNTKQFLVPLLCSWIYSVRLADNKREDLRFVIFLEEAHHTLYRGTQRAKETLMNTPKMSFFNLDWLNKKAQNYICDNCGHVLWFMKKN